MRLQPGAPEAGWIIDWLQRNGFDALLGIGPFGIMWWQWIVLLATLAFAWVGGRILGRKQCDRQNAGRDNKSPRGTM